MRGEPARRVLRRLATAGARRASPAAWGHGQCGAAVLPAQIRDVRSACITPIERRFCTAPGRGERPPLVKDDEPAAAGAELAVDHAESARECGRHQDDASRRAPAEIAVERAELARERGRGRSELAAEIANLRVQVDSLQSAIAGLDACRRLERRNLLAWHTEEAGRGGETVVKREDFRPSPEMVKHQGTRLMHLDNQTLVIASADKITALKARSERLRREIMRVDGVSWDEAHNKLREMDIENEAFYWIETMPFRLGITSAISCAVASVLLVFFPPVAHWYGVNVVGEELPDGIASIYELSINQVGTWTWSWMEPMIGGASFVLICCQFFRAQVRTMQMSPYTQWMLRTRAARLVAKYPAYNANIVYAWARTLPTVDMRFMPQYRSRGPGRF